MATIVCLSDDELRSVLSKLENKRDKKAIGLVCKRWLYLQRTETKKLNLSNGDVLKVTDSDLGVIADGFRCLRFLSLRYCRGITDAGMVKIVPGLSSLQFLDVSYCERLTDKGLSAVAEGCCNLQSLHLDCCRVTDKVLEALSKNCHNLQVLEMQRCTRITDSGLKILVSGCQLIKRLDIMNCRKITVVGIGVLLDKCQSLEYLDVRACPHVTKAGCYEAGLQFPNCCRLRIQHQIELSEEQEQVRRVEFVRVVRLILL